MLNMEFFNHLLILFGLMFGFTCFKVSNTSYFVEGGEAFDFKKLWKGTLRNIIVIMGATVVFSLSCVCGSDLFLIQMGETQVTLQSAIDLTTLTILAVYGVKYVKNLSEYAGITERVPEVKEILPELADRSVGTDEESKG